MKIVSREDNRNMKKDQQKNVGQSTQSVSDVTSPRLNVRNGLIDVDLSTQQVSDEITRPTDVRNDLADVDNDIISQVD